MQFKMQKKLNSCSFIYSEIPLHCKASSVESQIKVKW